MPEALIRGSRCLRVVVESTSRYLRGVLRVDFSRSLFASSSLSPRDWYSNSSSGFPPADALALRRSDLRGLLAASATANLRLRFLVLSAAGLLGPESSCFPNSSPRDARVARLFAMLRSLFQIFSADGAGSRTWAALTSSARILSLAPWFLLQPPCFQWHYVAIAFR